MAATLGSKALTQIAVSAQTGFGTAKSIGVSTGQNLFQNAIGVLDMGVTVDMMDGITVGRRTAVQAGAVTVTGKNPVVSLAEAPISLRELPIILSSVGATTSSTASPYTWSWSPSQTDVDTAKYYSVLMSDGVQKYRAVDAVASEITISGDSSGVVQAGVTLVCSDVASSSLSFPTALVSAPMLAGRLLRLSVDTDFPDKTGTGATDYDHLLSFNCSITTGMAMVNAMDAAITASTAGFVAPLDASLTITVASNSAATTNFPVTAIGTQKFLRIYGTDSNSYGLWLNGSWVIENVTPISSEAEGVVVNEISLKLAFDATSSKSLEIFCDSPLATAP